MRAVDYLDRFSDDESPEGWPDLDVDEILLGEWVAGKQPASVAVRRFLAECIRLFRAQLPQHGEQRQAELRRIREFYRRNLPEIVAIEASLVEIRRQLLFEFESWCMRGKKERVQ